jgi:hypothetical protein
MVTAERLRSILDYDPETGIIRWKINQRSGKKSGDIASYCGGVGYLCLRVDGRRYRAHRLIWLMQTGSWPTSQIDHVNGVRNDNRWINLREATPSQNCANSVHGGSFSGLKGAHYRPNRKGYKKWTSSIVKNRKLIYLGAFATAEEAHSAYAIAAARLHREFMRLA